MRFRWPTRDAWRRVPPRLAHLWRTSLQVRTVAITLLLTGAAILVTGIYMALSISNDLYQSRLDQALRDSSRATTTAQSTLNASDVSSGDAGKNLLNTVLQSVQASTSSRLVAAYRVPGQDTGVLAPPDRGSPAMNSVISPDLREKVQNGGMKQYYQSVALPAGGGTDPGIVVGSQLTLPSYGKYELYIGYNLRDSENTLLFVQNTLLVAGLALVLLIGAITWVIVRFVVEPIRVAARTSERLAAGDLAVRIPERGEDVFASLARSFNGMADSLQSQINQLATLSQLQQRFVSDVSHELRTPLTTIRLAGDVIYDQREGFPPATARTAELLHTQIERFDRLLSDLLEISRFDAGAAVLEVDDVNLVDVAHRVVDSTRPLADQRGVRLVVRSPDRPCLAEADVRRVERVVRNLVTNAIDHAGPQVPGGTPTVVVRVAGDDHAAAVAVRDYGVGLAPGESAMVFNRFWRADPARARTSGGTGLGLSISLEDAHLHGGWLQAWGRPSEGAQFRLTLPRRSGDPLRRSPIALIPDDVVEPV